MHEIHMSERRAFRGCRRRWDWSYREGYVPTIKSRHLDFGIAYHKALENFYDPTNWKASTLEFKLSSAILVFQDECEVHKQNYLDTMGLTKLPEEVEEDYAQRRELGEGMLNYHANYVHPKFDGWFKPVAVEIGFQVPISDPDYPDETLRCMLPDKCGQSHEVGAKVVYAGRVDMLVEDIRYGGYWIWDHKTAAQMATAKTEGFLDLDDQIGCVPMDTEALTPTGWKTRNQLNVGDLILAYDQETKSNKWTPIQRFFDYEDASLVELHDKRRSFVAKVTPSHRWIGERSSSYGKYAKTVNWEPDTNKVSTYKSKAAIFASAPSEVSGQLDITPDEAAFISWLLTDGSMSVRKYNYHHAAISQSWHKYADEIDDLIDRLGIYKHVKDAESIAGRGYTLWTFSSPEIRELWNRAGLFGSKHEVDLDTFVLSLSSKARKAFCKIGMMAEGSGNTFCQNEGSIKEAYRLAFYLEGCRPSAGSDKAFKVNMDRRPVVDTRTLTADPVKGTHRVWCVSTRYGSWVMRQGKVITITGNSYCWALTQELNIDVRGFIYAESRKDFPKPPKFLKKRMGGRSFSTATNQATSLDIFVPHVKEHDPIAFNEGAYELYIKFLESAEATQYHQRFNITKSAAELRNIGYGISLEAADMVDSRLRIYPSVGRFTCNSCAYREPCLNKFQDEDYVYNLETNFTKTTRRYWMDQEASSEKSNK